jgi:arylsulfatase A-like enzyme
MLPEEHGARTRFDRLSDGWTTLPERLQAVGFTTTGFAANFVNVGIETGFSQGFDRFEELREAPYARAERIHERVCEWLESRDAESGDPQFLYLHYLDPHRPYLAAGERTGTRASRRAGYNAELRYLDSWLGKTLAKVRASLSDRPIALVVTSDHGEELGEHGHFGHGSQLYRELVHVPGIVHLSDRSLGARSKARLDSRDVFELILLLTHGRGFDPESWAEGRSRSLRYASQYQEREAPLTRPEFAHTLLRRVEDGEFVLIWSGHGPTVEIYDVDRDRGEVQNVVPQFPEVRRRLERLLDSQPRFWATSEEYSPSPSMRRFLEALGYG